MPEAPTLNDLKQRALERTDLAELIVGDGVQLVRKGREHRGLCPFHDDRTPSLAVFGERGRQRFKCYGCDAAGDAIDWMQRRGSVSFREAVETLAGESAAPGSGTGAPRPRRNSPAPATTAKCHSTAAEVLRSLERKHGKATGRWIYKAADGTPCGVVARFDKADGKTYLPISKRNGGWTAKGMERPRPLYRLPELLAADAAELVFVCEGEKATDAAVAAGLLATTSPHGAKAAAASDWQALTGREVVLLPDHNTAGEDYAAEVAKLAREAGAAAVRVVRLAEHWAEMPAGGDLADYLAHLGDAEAAGRTVRELAAAAPEMPPPPAEANGDAAPDAASAGELELPEAFRPFPVGALPEPLGRFVSESAEAIGCDECMVALPLLAGLAGAVGNSRCMEPKPGWREPAILWLAVLCESGTGKSPAFREALAPIRRREQLLRTEHQAAVEAHREAEDDHKQALAKWKASRKLAEPPREPGEPPRPARLLVNDPTVEALAELLQHNPRGLLLGRDELAGWLAGFDRYTAGGKGGDAQKWLEAWDAGQWIVDRKQAGGAFVPRVSISIAGGIQPAVLRAAMEDRHGQHRENGLAARLLIARPTRRSQRWTDAAVAASTREAVAAVFEELLALELGHDEDGNPAPLPVHFEQGARELFIAHHDRLADELAELSGHLAAVWSKLRAYLCRFALLHHLARRAAGDNTAGGRIDARSVQAAAELVAWFAGEARRFEDDLAGGDGLSDDEQDRRQLLQLAMDHGGRITPRQLCHRSKRFRPASKARRLLSEAAALGLGRLERIERQGCRDGEVFILAGVSMQADEVEEL